MRPNWPKYINPESKFGGQFSKNSLEKMSEALIVFRTTSSEYQFSYFLKDYNVKLLESFWWLSIFKLNYMRENITIFSNLTIKYDFIKTFISDNYPKLGFITYESFYKILFYCQIRKCWECQHNIMRGQSTIILTFSRQ